MNRIKKSDTTRIWELYQKGLTYNRTKGLYNDTDTNNRMYCGDQWEGLDVGEYDKIQYNIIAPIVNYKVNTINSGLFAINYSSENIGNPKYMIKLDEYCRLLNMYSRKIWEYNQMDSIIRKISKQACINSEGILYHKFDEETNMPEVQIISKNNIFYGNENDRRIQKQPYIIIKQRITLEEALKLAEDNKIKETSMITTDKDTFEEPVNQLEVNDKVTILTMFYKKDGKIYYSKSFQNVDIITDEETDQELYPFSHMIWIEEENNARGQGDVKYIIPNQLEINKIAMRRAISTKLTAFPTKIALVDRIKNKSDINKVGKTIEVSGMDIQNVNQAFGITSVGSISPDAEKMQSELISTTRELKGAGDIATGSVNPEDASGRAILAVQNASQIPLNDQKNALYLFLEDTARVWFDLLKTYAKDLKVVDKDKKKDTNKGVSDLKTISRDKKQDLPEIKKIPTNVLQNIKTSVKIDITPKSAYDKYSQEVSLENLLMKQLITFDEYIDALDDDSVMPKQKLKIIQEKRKEKTEEINNIQRKAMAMQQASNQAIQQQQTIANNMGTQVKQQQETVNMQDQNKTS